MAITNPEEINMDDVEIIKIISGGGGKIKQGQGPYEANVNVLPLIGVTEGSPCKIGISLNEKDFFSYKDGFFFQMKSGSDATQTFQMGRTCKYETDNFYVLTSLSFPQGAPKSTLIEIAY